MEVTAVPVTTEIVTVETNTGMQGATTSIPPVAPPVTDAAIAVNGEAGVAAVGARVTRRDTAVEEGEETTVTIGAVRQVTDPEGPTAMTRPTILEDTRTSEAGGVSMPAQRLQLPHSTALRSVLR